MHRTSEMPVEENHLVSPEHDLCLDAPLPKAAMENSDDHYGIWCDVQRSVRYHRAREAFFQWYANAFSFLTLMAGSGVAGTLLSTGPRSVSIGLGIAVAAMQAIELVLQVSAKARLHNGLASEFSAIERIMAKRPAMSKDELCELRADILMIEAREPPIKRYLDLICHNQVARSIGSNDVEKLGFWQRRFAHWLSGETALQ